MFFLAVVSMPRVISNCASAYVIHTSGPIHPACHKNFPSEIRLSEVPADAQLGDLDLLFYDRLLDGDVEHVKLVDDPYLLVARPGDFPDGPVRLRQLDGRPMVADGRA